ncbi:hypothetical protein AXF42_Ash015846 [Apostasia shenzhenica]|uniref:FHA domain-containing protein n=1 Tax=Apostasia shenzhenica TaxID=1088818 RepID=A0A2H9ZXS7_9ASPA|nr:hypothetical protein AXF42_Ash015846 [Apostasia shenzhenica]
MVWVLVPVDALRGAKKHYIFARGAYKVGRKDCDIIVQTDSAVSRVHAEIVVDEMISHDPSCTGSRKSNSHVRVRDTSKFGTFINKEQGTKAVRLHNGEEATLRVDETVTFGTGNATFRFCFVPLIIFIKSSLLCEVSSTYQDTASSIGAIVTSNWSPKCTHALVSESSLVSLELIEAVLAKKFVVLADWFKVLAEKNIRAELPSCTSYVPSLNLDGNIVKIVEPKIRENFLEGYTFVLGSSDLYKFGDKIPLLLEIAGARFVSANGFSADNQTSADRENNRVILVICGESSSEFNHSRELSSLPTITDASLVAAILSGHLDSSVVMMPSILISSSHSTDETIVADSDVEIDTAASTHSVNNVESEIPQEICGRGNNHEKHGGEEDITKNTDASEIVNCSISLDKNNVSFTAKDVSSIINKLNKDGDSFSDRHENSDIIYSQELVVRNTTLPTAMRSGRESCVNFKCFRKSETVSGNSFRNLIPFSKDPYKESDYGKDQSNYMMEERKRKQLEAIAEELFNSEKPRKRAATAGTSLQALLARR